MPASGRRCAGLLACLLLLGGCTQWRYELGEPLPAAAAAFGSGEPPALGGVLSRLGPPLRVSPIAGGYALAWEYWEIDENSLGLSLGAFVGMDFLSLDWGEAHTRTQFLLLTFDRDHQLRDVSYLAWDSDAGGGRALQPFLGMLPVVDVDDLTEPLPQHGWGRAALERLPVTLNRNQHLDQGRAGLSQRGAPLGVGQRSLEMN